MEDSTYVCKFCGRITKNIYSLRSHQAYCKENPNRSTPNGHRWSSDELLSRQYTKGKVIVHNGNIEKYINKSESSLYIQNGWILGMSDNHKKLIKHSYSYRRKLTDQEELNRRNKISIGMKCNHNWEHNKKHGSAKQGWYNGVYCDSSWELAFLVYHIEHGIEIRRAKIRLPFVFNGETHIYEPDFIVNDEIIEIKGRRTQKSIAKEQQYPYIRVIDSKDIIPYIDYCVSKYGENFYDVLYNK